MPKLKPVYLQWLDAVSYDTEWKTIDQAVKFCKESKWLIEELGFIIYEDDNEIGLVTMQSPENMSLTHTVKGIQKIPKTWIKKRIDLTEAIYENRKTKS